MKGYHSRQWVFGFRVWDQVPFFVVGDDERPKPVNFQSSFNPAHFFQSAAVIGKAGTVENA